MSEGKVRKRRLSRNKPMILVLIVTLLMMFIYYVIAQILLGVGIATPIVLIFDGDILENKEKVTNIANVISIFGGFIVLTFYYLWYRPEYKWTLNKKEAWLFTAPILLFWGILFCGAYTIAAGHFTFGIPALNAAFPMIAAGICEEAAFREVGISYMRRQKMGEKMILPTVIFTSASFGFTHLFNAIRGNLMDSLIQSCLATMMGIFFGAIFIRTGNIWPCIIAHGMHDLLSACFEVNLGMDDMPPFVFAVTAICEVLLMIWGLYLIRKEKRPEIEALWSEKWQIPEPVKAEN